MLSILKTLTKNGRRAIYKSSVWNYFSIYY